ncbi:hypothetical protein NDU88_004219 [Pleurodeles waltl]|uniref:Uncharacterized protein n=1 Tax=Pleurodeles waltl TaxID=8319 RepID=A0AAV7L825_PLEWA|nr:hypothetical protein NDU88_004219 [Pleurodeles waltl]
MEDNSTEGDVQLVGEYITRENAKEAEPVGPPRHKPAKRQRVEGRQSKKAVKRQKTAILPDQAPAAVEAPGNYSSLISAEGEHISAIIKECFQSFAPLLFKGSGAGQIMGRAETEGDQQPLIKGDSSGTHGARSDQTAARDPTPAWGTGGKEQENVTAMRLSPEAYIRPSLGSPAMTTRSAGLANAIPLTVKERIWRKEFIDIFTLLEIQLEGLDVTVCDK